MVQDLGERLRDAQDALSVWYDRLNKQWQDAENVLRGFHLSRPVWICFHAEREESGYRDFEYLLGFAKVDGDWRLCYSMGETGDPDSHATKSILQCSLEQRKMALEGLPLLLERLVEEAETDAAEIETLLGAAAEATSPFKSLTGDERRKGKERGLMKVREVIRLIEADGWKHVRSRGSHRQFKHPEKRGLVTVPGKPNDELAPGTLNNVLKQAGLK